MRDTKTKGEAVSQCPRAFVYLLNRAYEEFIVSFPIIAGIWIWGTPVEMDVDGSKVSVLYLDTEGFESVGKSNVYDDRFVPRNELILIYFS